MALLRRTKTMLPSLLACLCTATLAIIGGCKGQGGATRTSRFRFPQESTATTAETQGVPRVEGGVAGLIRSQLRNHQAILGSLSPDRPHSGQLVRLSSGRGPFIG